MKKQSFIELVEQNAAWLASLEAAAFDLHARVNQLYDRTLPYGFHLRLTASYVSRYGFLVAHDEADVLILYAAAYLHDTIEDTRMSYHDLTKFIHRFNTESQVLPLPCRQRIESEVPDIVYALTNEKGRNREERANASYYKGIRETRFASFVKMCDRLANIRYSTLFVFTNRMLEIYRKEHPAFIRAIENGNPGPLPEAMTQDAERMFAQEIYPLTGSADPA